MARHLWKGAVVRELSFVGTGRSDFSCEVDRVAGIWDSCRSSLLSRTQRLVFPFVPGKEASLTR
jgi:hypothetical protein